MSEEDAPRLPTFCYRRGEISSYAFYPSLMPALKQELLESCRRIADETEVDELTELYIEGDKVLKRLPYNVHGPAGPPLFVLSELVETTPRAVLEAVLDVLDPSSDTGNEWLEAKAGLTSEVRSAIDTLARRLARLSGRRLQSFTA